MYMFLYITSFKGSKLIYNLHTIAEDVITNQKLEKLSSHFMNCVSLDSHFDNTFG